MWAAYGYLWHVNLPLRLKASRGFSKSFMKAAKLIDPKDGYRFVFHTPKYRHGAHTTPIDRAG